MVQLGAKSHQWGQEARVKLGTADLSRNVGPSEMMGTSCSPPSLRRDQEEVAVTGAGATVVRCRDGFPDGRGAGSSGGRHALMGTIGALGPAGSGCDRADGAVNGLLFPRSGHKMPLSLPSWESQLLRFGGQGGRETGKRLVTLVLSAPHPYLGTEGLSVTQPEASPGPGHSVAFVPRAREPSGAVPVQLVPGEEGDSVRGGWPGQVG